MWTDTTRKQFARSGLRLPSDLTDAEWAVLEPLLPRRSHRGRPPLWSYREIVEAMLYLLRGGLPWRMLPPGLFPPMTTALFLSLARRGTMAVDQSHPAHGAARSNRA
jgi:transposase